MTTLKVCTKRSFLSKFYLPVSPCILKKSLKSLSRATRFCETTANTASVPQAEENPDQKLLKVAVVGKTNAGKSSLINQILKLNVCDVSSKVHTTLLPLKAAFVSGNTQILFVDTPGLFSKREVKKYSLKEKIPEWTNAVLENVDVVAVVHDVTSHKNYKVIFPQHLIEMVKDVPKSKTLVLLVNKMDLVDRVQEQDHIISKINKACSKLFGNENKFLDMFLISALKNEGVEEFKNFLLEKAVPGKWLIKPGHVSDTPLIKLIQNLLRAQLLNILPQEVPYLCKYEVEYLEENESGIYVCIALITFKKPSHLGMFLNKNRKNIQTVCQNIKSDLYFITNKQFSLKLIAQSEQEKNS